MLSLLIESWIWYAVAISIVLCRWTSRTMLLGSPLRLKVDDYIMIFAVCTYTALVVCMNIVADKSSNLIPPGVDVSKFSKQEIDDRVLGSKLVLVVEVLQCFTIWTLKTTLLIMYYRVTFQLPQNLYVKILAAYVGIGFVVMEILYFGVWCRPFHNYWAVPTPNPQCDAATDHLITNAVLNISSDLVMLVIGFSMAIKSKLPWKRKIIIHAIFALGIFVIIAAVLNKFYSFTQPYGSLWTFWYIREASTAMIVANLPYTWTLIRRVFKVGSFDGESDTNIKFHSSRTARGRRAKTHTSHPPILHGESMGSDKRSSASDSRNDSTVDHLRSGKSSPVVERKIKPLHPEAVKRTWRERGVYGREDVEAWGSDDEDGYEAQEAQRRFSLAIAGNPSSGPHEHDDLVLHDVGSLGERGATLPQQPAQSHPGHSRQTSNNSNGRQSPEFKRPNSWLAGAPESVGRSVSVRQSGQGSEPKEQKPMYYSGRSKAKMPAHKQMPSA